MSFEGYPKQEFKRDPRYVKWIFRMVGIKNGAKYEKILPYHECTESDYDQFYPLNVEKAPTLEAIRKDPNRGFFCIDWDSEEVE